MSVETIYQVDNVVVESHNMTSNNDIESLQLEIVQGLLSNPKNISSKFFYDEIGSQLFEEITMLEEYYPTRTEKAILKEIAPELLGQAENLQVIELGSGDCSKISILLGAIPENNHNSITYTPIDISESAVLQATKELKEKFPQINIEGIVTDFMSHPLILSINMRKMFCFLGSTIGNLTRAQANAFVKKVASAMQEGDKLLLGMDLVKDIDVVLRAYNDKKNVTAAFNKNILRSINGIIETSFAIDDFEHLAIYNGAKSRIEMHLIAKKDVAMYIPVADEIVKIEAGERIHTENSHKFTAEDIYTLGKKANLMVNQIFYDKQKYFSVVEFIKQK